MKGKKKLIPRIIMIIMVLLLAIGIIFTVVDFCKGKSGAKQKINDDGEVITLDDIPGKMDQHTVLLSASQRNNGLVSMDEDYYQSFNWKVYYDGTVEYYESYNLSGRTTTVTWELTNEQFDRLIELLQGSFFNYTEDYESACDGDTWHYTYYNLEGEKLHSYNGYNYSVPVLLDISEILDSDKRDQAVIEPVEMSDSHNILIDVTWDRQVEDKNADELVSTHWMFYYDGWVEAEEVYQIGGTQSTKTWKLDDYAYGKLIRELNYHSEDTVNEDKVQGEDYLTLTYYEEFGDEIYSAKATAARENIFSAIWEELQIPEDGFSYIEASDAKVGYSTNYKVGDYSVTIESVNPGHTDSTSLFTTYFYWQDAENSITTIHMEYWFAERSLQESRELEKFSTTTINGETYYYNVYRRDYGSDTLWLYCENDENSYMMISLETTGWYNEDYKWVDETGADIEKILQDEVLQQAISFQVTKE